MADKAKVVLTDYVWESLDVERKLLEGLADLVPLKTKKPDEFIGEAQGCDALLNTYAGPITAEVMALMPSTLTAACASTYRRMAAVGAMLGWRITWISGGGSVGGWARRQPKSRTVGKFGARRSFMSARAISESASA